MLTDVRRLPTHGGSLRMFVQRSGTPSGAVRRLLAEEEAIGVGSESYYQDFAARVRSVQTSLVSMLESLKAEGKRIAGYAVSAKGAILLNSAGVDGRLVDYLVDRSPHKQGKFMPGIHLPIYHPDEAARGADSRLPRSCSRGTSRTKSCASSRSTRSGAVSSSCRFRSRRFSQTGRGGAGMTKSGSKRIS